MCLMLTVRLADVDSARRAEILQAAGLSCAPKRWWSWFARTSSSGGLNIPGPEGGCGCSFLADSADGDAPTWDMDTETLPRLVSTLRAIREHTTASFSFEALWIDESAVEERRTSFDELIHVVEQNRLGTKTRYLIDHGNHDWGHFLSLHFSGIQAGDGGNSCRRPQ